MDKITIYCDGACSGNPGPGGWAAILRWNNQIKEIYGFDPQTTNNRMEMLAAINALESIDNIYEIAIYTDSKYLQNGITLWIKNWKRKGWKKAGGEIKNLDLWQRLDVLQMKFNAQWFWVAGHSGDYWNDRADLLARKAILNAVS